VLQRLDTFREQVAGHYRRKGYSVHEGPKVRGKSGQVYAVDLVCEGPLGGLLVSFGDAGGVDPAEVGRVRVMARDVGASPVIAAPRLEPAVRAHAVQLGVAVLDEASVADGADPTMTAHDGTRSAPGAIPAPDEVQMPMDLIMPRSLDEYLRAHPWPRSGTVEGVQTGPLRAREVDDILATVEQAPRVAAKPLSVGARSLWRSADRADRSGALPDAQPAPQPSRPDRFSWLGIQQAAPQPAAAPTPAPPAAATPTHRVLEEEPRHTGRWLLAAVALLGLLLLARAGFFSGS